MNNLSKILTSVAVSALFSAQAMAATDGTVGVDSTASSDVSLSVADRVQISNVKDIAFGTYGGTGDLVENSSYCVYRNGGGDYQLTLTTIEGSFEVTDGTNTIPYAVKVDDSADASLGTAMTYNTAAGPLVGSPAVDCGGTDNAAMEVTFSEADLQAAGTAAYSGTVTLYVEPI